MSRIKTLLFLYTHRLMEFSALTRGGSLYSGQWLTQRLITGQSAENKDCGVLSHNWDIYIISIVPQA